MKAGRLRFLPEVMKAATLNRQYQRGETTGLFPRERIAPGHLYQSSHYHQPRRLYLRVRDVIADERRSGNKDGSSLSLGGHSIAASVDSQITSGENLGIMVDIR